MSGFAVGEGPPVDGGTRDAEPCGDVLDWGVAFPDQDTEHVEVFLAGQFLGCLLYTSDAADE